MNKTMRRLATTMIAAAAVGTVFASAPAAAAEHFDWRNADIVLPQLGNCAAGTYTFHNGVADENRDLGVVEDLDEKTGDFLGGNYQNDLVLFQCGYYGNGSVSAHAVVSVGQLGSGNGRLAGAGVLVVNGVGHGSTAVRSYDAIQKAGQDDVAVTLSDGTAEGRSAVYHWNGRAFVSR
ncbi:hypothetical protein [Fodinicola acaciae]|uniref:hypothetical protein n=1 Tax=Fodinicola acaciae TaxID=2681555 RepID=UPI0013D82E40|nr:hypothetical protein [Fodinicola acaciae]